ncbi:hypothetical protein GW793_03855 [bacterium]|uniref:Vitamin K epoxide reductase domain-containing protein n=2 Tax=Katanobacteria TaxID=422282 RepID=A0A2M7X1F2_UNCKA|nr:hypothetical protein [bacterium]PIP56035.1 MAG: hypothetical protein COX05_05150 [candidate division WWE3 bacterium CG22_combo_CG10-13_8_21_14_all_39_12]PJA40015.1 MAG: hypothetical protein CO179_03675 [candidate division WWE3 bacterium CG_4_9_14_3_um_filter_39_7]
MKLNLRVLLPVILSGGVILSWSTVFQSFVVFYGYEGTIFKFTNCTITNPFLTPCFYGALGFGAALIWSSSLYLKSTKGLFGPYRYLTFFLLFCTIFGWGNVAYEVWEWFKTADHTISGCGGKTFVSPLQSPCVWGSVFYLISLIVVSSIYRKTKRD